MSRLFAAALVGISISAGLQTCRSAPPNDSSAPPPRDLSAPPHDADGSLLASTAAQQTLIAAYIEREANVAIVRSRQQMAADPAAAQFELKTVLHYVATVPELSAAQRANLRGRLELALRDARRRQTEREHALVQRQAAQAAGRERQRVDADLDRGQEKVKQLVERFDSLLGEGRYALAEEVADQADPAASSAEIRPALTQNVRLAGAARNAAIARRERQQGVVKSLEQVELAGIARADDQPIVYVEAQEWQDMTQRRAAYARNESGGGTPAEVRISRALAEPTEFSFVEIPLADAMEYLKDLHGIEIQFDAKALDNEGIGLDTPVTMRVGGVSLRSALRLLLGSLDLTYAIDNEVLLVTSPDRARDRVVPKVYPVADLVLPIRTPNFSGGFGQLGGFNQNRGGQGNGNGMNPMGQNPNNNNPFNQGPPF